MAKKFHKWDRSLRTEGWLNDIKHIITYANLDISLDNEGTIDLDVLKARLIRTEIQKWRTEISEKSRLRTYVEIYDEIEPCSLVRSNITRNQRSILGKLKL